MKEMDKVWACRGPDRTLKDCSLLRRGPRPDVEHAKLDRPALQILVQPLMPREALQKSPTGDRIADSMCPILCPTLFSQYSLHAGGISQSGANC